MSTSWAMSRQVVFDESGVPAAGALAYFFNANTSTPRTTYQDAALSTPHEHPVEADANGRFPRVFLQYESYDEKVTTAAGVQLWHDTEIPNPEPTDPSDAVDQNALLSTGDTWWSPINSTRSGAVRLNGRTIGNAASGATERANADTEDLFTFLWNNLANGQAAVSGGRGASASADYAANKTITLPSAQGGGLFGLDDMGNTAAGVLASAPFTNGNGTTAGSLVGENTHELTEAELTEHLHANGTLAGDDHLHAKGTLAGDSHAHGSGNYTAANHTHGYEAAQTEDNFGTGSDGTVTDVGRNVGSKTTGLSGALAVSGISGGSGVTISGSTANAGVTISGSMATTGSGDAHNIVQRGLLGTWFIKL